VTVTKGESVKGIVFNLLEQIVTTTYGVDTWEDLLDNAGVSGVYTSLGSYPDEELERLVQAACNALSLTRSDVLRWFGVQAMPLLAEAYPKFFADHTASKTFLAGINSVIHAEVRKLYPGAACPHFNIGATASGALTLDYISTRRMCALAQGFVEGAANYFCEEVDFRHATCVDRGDDLCRFEISWTPRLNTAA
jgi:hypothetical protein